MQELEAKGRIALVTGANKGIGFETARALAAKGATVLIGARDLAAGQKAAEAIVAEGGSAEAVQIEITDEASAAAAAALIGERFGKLDVLVNNAAVSLEKGREPSEADITLLRQMYDTNVVGTVIVTNAMLPLLRKSDAARIVNMSTGLASFALTAAPDSPFASIRHLGYISSKAAVNSATIMYANELRASGIKVNAANPGLCATDLSAGKGQPASEGARVVVELALLGPDGPSGGFFDSKGKVPW